MAQAARAYQFDVYAEDQRARSQARDMRAIRTGAAPSPDARSSTLVMLGKAAAVLLVVVAALCFARIALTNATVTTMLESDNLSSQIAEARTSGVDLEMEQSLLTSTSAINAAVKRLGMAAPYGAETLELPKDVVSYDSRSGLPVLAGTLQTV